MKRTLTITVIAVNLLLLIGWLTFEWVVNDDATSEDRVEQNQGGPGTEAPGVTLEPRQDPSAVTESSLTQPPSEGKSRFDWRRPRGGADSPARQGADTITRRPERSRPDMATPPAEAPRQLRERPTAPRERVVSSTTTPPARPSAAAPEPTPPAEDRPRDDSEDIDPPELEWIRFAPPEIAAGQEAALAANAVDDLAGVRDIVGRLSSPSGNAHLGFALPRNEGTGTWETLVKIPDKAEPGRWQITWLRITDKANNARDHRWTGANAPHGSALIVSSPEGDGDPPILQSVLLDRQTVAQGEAVQVRVLVTDEASGVRFVSGTFQSPSGKAWAPFTASEEGALWTGAVTIPEDGECGEWTLRRVTAIDHANNQATWSTGDERISGVTFYRSFSGSCDSDPPVLTRLDLSPKTVSNEQDSQIEITAFIDDLGSGVANASGFAMAAEPGTAESPQRVHFVLRKSADTPGAPWVGTIQIPRHSMRGRWDIRALRVADEARNQRTYAPADPAMVNAWFLVE